MHSNPASTLARRSFVLGGGLWALSSVSAFALTSDEATGFITRLVADIDAVIASGKSETQMIRAFEGLFLRYADVNIMAQYALGADGRAASASEKSKFAKAFAGYISRKYGKRFRSFIGGRIEIKGTRKIKAGYEVRTIAHLRGEAPIEVIFLVSDKSGKGQFFNMFIEGVNLLLTERAEIGSLLDSNGRDIGALTVQLSKAG
ncbi:MAG: MlaC/ttg2D family ABC transporter substrate-binding protein [Sulfitobacter sp.]